MAKKATNNPAAGGLSAVFAPEALEFRPRDLLAGTELRRVYAILAFPPAVAEGWLGAAANLPGVAMVLHGRPEDTYRLVQAVNRRIGAIPGQLAMGNVPALTAQRLQAELDDAQALLRQVDGEKQAVFQTGVFLVVSAADPDDLRQRCERLEGTLAAQGMRARPLVFFFFCKGRG